MSCFMKAALVSTVMSLVNVMMTVKCLLMIPPVMVFSSVSRTLTFTALAIMAKGIGLRETPFAVLATIRVYTLFASEYASRWYQAIKEISPSKLKRLLIPIKLQQRIRTSESYTTSGSSVFRLRNLIHVFKFSYSCTITSIRVLSMIATICVAVSTEVFTLFMRISLAPFRLTAAGISMPFKIATLTKRLVSRCLSTTARAQEMDTQDGQPIERRLQATEDLKQRRKKASNRVEEPNLPIKSLKRKTAAVVKARKNQKRDLEIDNQTDDSQPKESLPESPHIYIRSGRHLQFLMAAALFMIAICLMYY